MSQPHGFPPYYGFCTQSGKRIYGDRKAARRIAKLTQAKYGGRFRAYPCPTCEGFHVGSAGQISRAEHRRLARIAGSREGVA